MSVDQLIKPRKAIWGEMSAAGFLPELVVLAGSGRGIDALRVALSVSGVLLALAQGM